MTEPQIESDAPETTGLAPSIEDLAAAPDLFTIDFEGGTPETPVEDSTPTEAPQEDQAEESSAARTSPDSSSDRLANAERQVAEMRGTLNALTGGNRQRTPAGPPVSLDHLTSGNASPAELMQYLSWQQSQNTQQVLAHTQFVAQRANSEQKARGEFSTNSMGKYDFDSMRSKHLTGLYEQNPAVQQLVNQAAYDDPARAEYTLAAVYEIMAHPKMKADPVAGFKYIFDALEGQVKGEKNTVDKIQNALNSGADKMLRATGGPGRTRRVGSNEDMTSMSDAEFEKFYQQTGN